MSAGSSSKPKRPFWMHQLVEYILGGLLVAQGLQSAQPVLPALAGAMVMINAATVKGPWAAFQVIGRQLHRTLDLVIIAVIVVLALQPWAPVDPGARIVMVGIATVMAFVWWQSSFAEKVSRRERIDATGGRSTEVGRLAGRAVGDGINAAKRLKRP